MNWGTGSKPTYLALKRSGGKVEVGMLTGNTFRANEQAKRFMHSQWQVWQPSSPVIEESLF